MNEPVRPWFYNEVLEYADGQMTDLARAIETLPLLPEHIMGNVGVIGANDQIPEKALLYSPDSAYSILREGITDFVYFDRNLQKHIVDPGDLEVEPLETPQAVQTHQPSAETMAHHITPNVLKALFRHRDGYFTSFVMLGVADLESLVDQGLLDSLSRVVAPGGFITLTGPLACDLPLTDRFRIVEAVDLPQPHGTDPVHKGYILQVA